MPILPPKKTLYPAFLKILSKILHVVDFPFVPVIEIILIFLFISKNISRSVIIFFEFFNKNFFILQFLMSIPGLITIWSIL